MAEYMYAMQVWEGLLFARAQSRDIDRAVSYYADHATLRVAQPGQRLATARGAAAVRESVATLAASLKDVSALSVPVKVSEERLPNGSSQVWVVWRCPASGLGLVTETLWIDRGRKIFRHYVAVLAGATGVRPGRQEEGQAPRQPAPAEKPQRNSAEAAPPDEPQPQQQESQPARDAPTTSGDDQPLGEATLPQAQPLDSAAEMSELARRVSQIRERSRDQLGIAPAATGGGSRRSSAAQASPAGRRSSQGAEVDS
eukprot:TRINITY_DN36331_c0_g1_i1.p1 TRINITY_DN36331_c0_g1~~TRINITY_DN36331_c0_g1_i1.p1  ORF type:complete len:278 (+),score=60.10 TRINITY_DN36331_c0_g1_i1:69-836(+)